MLIFNDQLKNESYKNVDITSEDNISISDPCLLIY